METPYSASLQAVLNAMRSVGREDAMRELWGSRYGSLIEYLALACMPTDVGLDILLASIARHPMRKTMVLTGERCSGADLEYGTDSPILLGLVPVMEALKPVSRLRSAERNGREPNALSLIFSGGMTLAPELGEVPGNVMAEQFNAITDNVYRDVVGAESFSLNTGDQARVLAAIVFARKIERLVFCHVVDHIGRFAATVTLALKRLIDAENELVEEQICKVRRFAKIGVVNADASNAVLQTLEASRREMPEMIFISFGDWSDRDPRRGRDNNGEGISRAREAFGPMQTAEDAIRPNRRLGCEYAERYYAEQNWMENSDLSCPAMLPDSMSRCIPGWVKDRVGYFVSR